MQAYHSGGTVEVRVNSPSGNILVAQKLEAAAGVDFSDKGYCHS